MAAGGETFAILTFLVGSGVAIGFLDWLLGGVGEAFGIDETPWGDVVELPREAKTVGGISAGEGQSGRRSSITHHKSSPRTGRGPK